MINWLKRNWEWQGALIIFGLVVLVMNPGISSFRVLWAAVGLFAGVTLVNAFWER